MNQIHPSALIGSDVKLGNDIIIGPYTVIEGNVTIGDGCVIGPSSYITGWVKIGKNCRIYSFSAIGNHPQDYSFNGEPGQIILGDNCLVREGATVHTPVHGDKGETTVIGNNVFLMGNSHVGHNSKVGDNCQLVQGSMLAGFVTVENDVIISGNAAVHQFCRVGAYSMIGGISKVVQDIPPYMTADGNPATGYGLNSIGLKRKGIGQEQRTRIKEAYRVLFSGKGRKEALEEMRAAYSGDELIERIVVFVESTKRGIVSYHGS
jgi:UDP-N-acetylglucosamine acyltransferase